MPALSGVFVADPCEFKVTLGSESVTFIFDRAKMTLRRDRDMKRAFAADDLDGLVKYLMVVLISWDVVDETGAPVQLSDDILLDLSVKSLTGLIEGMGKAAQPSDAEGEASSVPSPERSTDSSELVQTHQNGATTSQLPGHSASPSPT
jgi:hypothetical protein